MKKKILLGASGIIALVAIAYAVFSGFTPPTPKTPDGLFFEQLLPVDPAAILSFNPTDETERERFSKLWNTVLQDKANAVAPFLVTQFAENAGIEISLEEILKTFGDQPNFLFALQSTPAATHTFVQVKDRAVAAALVEKIQKSNSQIGVGLVSDILFFTSDKSEAPEIQERAKRFQKDSFVKTKLFRTAFKNLKPQHFSGYIFISPEFQNLGHNLPFLQMVPANAPILSNILVFNAEQDGLTISGLTQTDNASLKTSALKSIFNESETYLYKKITTKTPVFFMNESHHIGTILQNKFPKEIFENFKNLTGFDFETDIQPILDKNSLLVLEDSGTIIPALSWYIDASGAPEKARAIANKLDEKIPAWIELANLSFKPQDAKEPVEPIFESEKTEGPGITVKLHFSRIPEETAALPLFRKFTDPIEISYGIRDGNILYFTLGPMSVMQKEKSMVFAEHPLIEEAFKRMSSFGTLSLLDIKAIRIYAKRILEFAEKEKTLSEQEKQFFDLAEKYLAPISGAIQVSQGDGKNIKSGTFVKIKGS